MSTTKKATKQEQEEARQWLNDNLKPGQTIYTSLKKVSRSGMSRKIDLFAVIDGDIVNLNFYYIKASGGNVGTLGSRNAWENGITATGCGMDMGYHLVSTLSYLLTDYKNYRLFQHRWL